MSRARGDSRCNTSNGSGDDALGEAADEADRFADRAGRILALDGAEQQGQVLRIAAERVVVLAEAVVFVDGVADQGADLARRNVNDDGGSAGRAVGVLQQTEDVALQVEVDRQMHVTTGPRVGAFQHASVIALQHAPAPAAQGRLAGTLDAGDAAMVLGPQAAQLVVGERVLGDALGADRAQASKDMHECVGVVGDAARARHHGQPRRGLKFETHG